MASFGDAVAMVFRHEGGFVDNLKDPGGATKYGITQAVLSAWYKRPMSRESVSLMDSNTAKDIYKTKYWNAIQGDAITSQDVANWCMDMSVLRGVSGAVTSIQQALGVTADGNFGPKTLAALNLAAPATFLNVFRSLCVKQFAAIVVARPLSLCFLQGWLKRVEEIVDVINLLAQKSESPNP